MSTPLCQQCGKNKSIMVLSIDGLTYAICAECKDSFLTELGVPIQGEASFWSLVDVLTKLTSREKPPCPQCGMSWQEFAETQRLGCSNDYSHFADELKPIFKKYHKAVQHVGHAPISAITLEEAESFLKASVTEERYEEAAKWRDLIKLIQARKKVI